MLKFEFGTPKGYRKVCQRCGSEHLKSATTPWKGGTAAFAEYRCQDCQFEGPAIEAEEKMIREMRRQWEQKQKNKQKNNSTAKQGRGKK